MEPWKDVERVWQVEGWCEDKCLGRKMETCGGRLRGGGDFLYYSSVWKSKILIFLQPEGACLPILIVIFRVKLAWLVWTARTSVSGERWRILEDGYGKENTCCSTSTSTTHSHSLLLGFFLWIYGHTLTYSILYIFHICGTARRKNTCCSKWTTAAHSFFFSG